MECDFVYEDLEGFFNFKNMHVESIRMHQFSKVVSRAPLRNQQGAHLIGLCR
jgi:hypothetical protein